jgi:hypothetical protein
MLFYITPRPPKKKWENAWSFGVSTYSLVSLVRLLLTKEESIFASLGKRRYLDGAMKRLQSGWARRRDFGSNGQRSIFSELPTVL